jgi:hypothetical protein
MVGRKVTMSISKSWLNDPALLDQGIWVEIENDEIYSKLGLKRSSLTFVQIGQSLLNNLPDQGLVVDVELRSIGQGSWNVWLVRNDGGGGQDYHSALAGSVHK